jgi:tetratricopeptide (TPR) repeat protein
MRSVRRSILVRACQRAVALLVGAIWLLASGPRAEAAARLDSQYLELLRRYARGERPQAIASLGEWSEGALRKQLANIQRARLAAERCPKCPNPLAGVPLRAAVMLHADRDKAERPEPSGREQTPRCPGPHARIAGQYAAILARDSETEDFARRFFLAMALRWQLEACFEDAHSEARAGIELFPRDGSLLLAAGSVLEERAALTTTSVRPDAAAVQQGWLKEARRDFTEAVSIEPDLALARLRLGRVLWRLGQPEPARAALEEALTRAADPKDRYLAHLFLGRIHEDAQRLDRALAEYRHAVDIDPQAQSAAVALSHALQLAGQAEEARRTLAAGLVQKRTTRDAYWDYLVENARQVDDLLATLHSESLE